MKTGSCISGTEFSTETRRGYSALINKYIQLTLPGMDNPQFNNTCFEPMYIVAQKYIITYQQSSHIENTHLHLHPHMHTIPT